MSIQLESTHPAGSIRLDTFPLLVWGPSLGEGVRFAANNTIAVLDAIAALRGGSTTAEVAERLPRLNPGTAEEKPNIPAVEQAIMYALSAGELTLTELAGLSLNPVEG